MLETTGNIIINAIAYILIGTFLSWVFYSYKKKDLIGGFVGGIIVGTLGAVILGGFFLGEIIKNIIEFLQKGAYLFDVNILAAIIGGYILLYIYNKINHDKNRKDY